MKLSAKFNRCVKSVRKTVKARRGSNKESAAIAICTTSVLQKRGRTMKRYRKGRLTTQRKFRGGISMGSDFVQHGQQKTITAQLYTSVLGKSGETDVDVDVSGVPDFMNELNKMLAKITQSQDTQKSFLQRAVSKVGNMTGNVASKADTIAFLNSLISNKGKITEDVSEVNAVIARLSKEGF